MQKLIISLICCLLPAFAHAAQPEVRDNAPDRHVVVKGDTLWDISAKFFTDPWKWPQIWGMNKDTIKDPHWIYPGDIIYLDRSTGTLHIGEPPAKKAASEIPSDLTQTKLSPRIREDKSRHDAIPSIPVSEISPFLSIPVILDSKGFEDAPTLAAAREGRSILGNGDIAYVKGLPQGNGPTWQVYRPGKMLIDPDTKQVLGQEAPYLGDVTVEILADVSTVRVTRSVQEIRPGDRLYQTPLVVGSHYLPRAPEKNISAKVISIYGDASLGGRNSIITLNKGYLDGLEGGHVLALYRKGKKVDKHLTLPDERYGLMFVFLTFKKLSYALVTEAHLPVELLDLAQTP